MSITYRFEEVPAIEIDGFVAGRVDGTATVVFDAEGTWDIIEIFVDLDNDKLGKDAVTATRKLSLATHPQQFFALEEQIGRVCGDAIGAKVWEVIDEMRERRGTVRAMQAAE